MARLELQKDVDVFGSIKQILKKTRHCIEEPLSWPLQLPLLSLSKMSTE